ncbi:MAG TPA: ubiquitin-like domain-containing protein [Gemmatimonadales bacterium]
MTAAVTGQRFAVRVMVTPVWDQVFVPVDADTTVAQLKRDALQAALKRSGIDPDDYVIKFRGAQVLDESVTLGRLGAVPNAPFIVLPARRQPVR